MLTLTNWANGYMTIPEVIAKLDSLERELDGFRLKLKTLRQDLKDTLDFDSEPVVD